MVKNPSTAVSLVQKLVNIYVRVVRYRRLNLHGQRLILSYTTGPDRPTAEQPTERKQKRGEVLVRELERNALIARETAFLLQDLLYLLYQLHQSYKLPPV